LSFLKTAGLLLLTSDSGGCVIDEVALEDGGNDVDELALSPDPEILALDNHYQNKGDVAFVCC